MKTYQLDQFTLVPTPQMVVVDSNVLIAAFLDTGDGRHDTAKAYLDLLTEETRALVAVPVLVECWGWMVGSRKARGSAIQLLTWTRDPLVTHILPGYQGHSAVVGQLSDELSIDLVDAWLMHLASEITTSCDLSSRVKIATFDTRDFYRCAAFSGMNYSLLDLNSFDEIDIG